MRIVANIRNLAPLIDKVMENITQYFVPERDPWFNKGFQQADIMQAHEYLANYLELRCSRI